MLTPKLLATITALLLIAGTSELRAEYNLSQLQEIERLVLSKNTAALGRFLTANPQIMSGADPLARELRSFLDCVEDEQLDCFASPKVVKYAVQTSEGIAAPNPTPIY